MRLAKYVPEEAKDAERIIERVMPRLQHANSAVVLSAIKVILQYMHEALDPESELCVGYRKKLSPPLRDDGGVRRPLFARVASMASRGAPSRPGDVAPSTRRRRSRLEKRRSTPPSPSSATWRCGM